MHAISGGQAPKTMKVVGSIESVPATVLLDSWSSHNFLSESLAQKIQLQPVKGPTIRVMVASGEKLTSKGKCVSVMVKLGKFFTKADFYILSLEGYDVVIGTQWLHTLGEIMWDFSKMIMRFQSAGKMITLKGLTDQVVDSHEINRLSSKQPIGALVQIMAIEDHDQLEQGSDAPELQELLGSFSELFREPTGLPPNRVHDHKIPLQLGNQPMCSRPYRYPHY